MKKSLRTCVAVLVACLMVLEVPLFAFADQYAAGSPASDDEVTQEAEDQGSDQPDQAENDASADNTEDSAQGEESSVETQPSQTDERQDLQGSAGAPAEDSRTSADLSELLDQLGGASAADQITLTIPDAVKDGNYFFIANDKFSISEKSTQKLYVPIQRTGDLTSKAEITLKLVDVTSHKGVNYKAEIYNENVEGYNKYEDVSMVDLMKDNADTTYESSGEITDEELDSIIAGNGGKLDVLDSDNNVVGSLTSSTPYNTDKTKEALSDDQDKTSEAADTGSSDAAENKAESSNVSAKDAAAPAASNEGSAQAAEKQPAADAAADSDADNSQEDEKAAPSEGNEGAPADEAASGNASGSEADDSASAENDQEKPDGGSAASGDADSSVSSDDQTASDENKAEEAKTDDQNKDQAAAEQKPEKEKPAGLTGTGNPLKDARNQFTNTVSDRQEISSSKDNKDSKTETSGDASSSASAPAAAQAGDVDEEFVGTEYRLDFDAGERVKYLEITPIYSEKAEGDSILMLLLREPSEGFNIEDSTRMSYVNILDEDKTEEAFLSFADSIITADGDKAVVTVTRSGAINKTISATLTSVDGSAEAGKDFSGVGAKLYFPMGITKRTVEIPVGHSDEEKDFSLMLVSPEGCSIVNDEVEVLITSKGNVSVQDSTDIIDNTVDGVSASGSYNLSLATGCGNAWYDSSTGIFYASGKGQEDKTWHGMNLKLEKGYLYDGVRVTSNLTSNKPSFGFSTISSRDGEDKFLYTVKDATDRFNSWQCDYLFGRPNSPETLETRTVTTSSRGRTMGVSSVQAISRNFTFNLKPAEGLTFKGCSDAEAAKYQSVIINTDLTQDKITVKSNGNFAVSAIGTEYARLVGVDAVANGKTYRIADVNKNSRTVTINVNTETINALAENGFITWKSEKKTLKNTDASVESYSGSIDIRPVFEYINATVTVNTGKSGNLKVDGTAYTASTEIKAHLGDKLALTTEVTGANADALGVSYEKSQSEGSKITASGTYDYIDGAYSYLVDSGHSVIAPTFNEHGNSVKVRISESDIAYFDTSAGSFKGLTPSHESGYYVYTVADNAKVNQIIQLVAKTKKSSDIAVWKDMRSDDTYSGEGFYYMAAAEAKNNIITLSADTDEKTHSDYTMSGTLITPVMNLSTGNYTEDTSVYASNAVIVLSTQVKMADEKGHFDIDPFYAKGGTKVRYAVSYNGGTELKEVTLPSADAKGRIITYTKPGGTQTTTLAIPVTTDYINISEYSLSGPHFTAANVKQDKLYVTSAQFIEMNGKKTVLQVEVHDGDPYTVDGKEYTEKVTGVQFMFVDPKTNEIRGLIEAKKSESTAAGNDLNSSVWEHTFDKFSPSSASSDEETEGNEGNEGTVNYNYGDVLYVRMITNKKISAVSGEDIMMTYKPVSTGFSVITDTDYKPQTLSVEPDLSADAMTGGETSVQDTTRATYGQFPFMGEIQFFVKVVGRLSEITSRRADIEYRTALYEWSEIDAGVDDSYYSDYSLDDHMSMQSGEAAAQGISNTDMGRNVQVTVVAMLKNLPYGGTRLLFGVRVGVGTSDFSKISDPFTNAETATGFFGGLSNKFGEPSQRKISDPKVGTMGGAYASVALQIGVYFDFGYMNIETEKDDGTTEYSHSAVLLGGGVYIGGTVSVGAYIQTVIVVVPVYIGVSANVSTNIFMGITSDPKKTLDEFNNGNDGIRVGAGGVNFNIEWNTTVSVSGYAGVGIIGALGVRATITLSVDFGYSPKMKKFFPNVGSDWGLLTTFTASGSVDFFGMSIPLASYTMALPGAQGFSAYFKEVRMGNIVIKYVNEAITEKIENGKGSEYQEAIDSCKAQIKELKDMIDSYACTADAIAEKTNALREYAYENNILSSWQYAKSNIYSISGLASLLSADGGEDTEGYFVRERTDSEWVANAQGDISLQGTFEAKNTTELVKNAYDQTSSKLIDIGDHRILMVFLDTDTSRDKTQLAVLKYSIYDSARDEWTIPKVIQDDATGDTTPNLCDTGDSVMISWASADPVKYAKLTDDDKKDASKIMSCYEIYTVQFDKTNRTLGEIVQLTDDPYCDSTPQGIYDSGTGDRIVLYLKSAPDNDYKEDDLTAKALEYINPYSGKVYTVVTYMLYDAKYHEWARDYKYTSEIEFEGDSEASFTEKWKGQRFLPSVLKAKSGSKPASSDDEEKNEHRRPVVQSVEDESIEAQAASEADAAGNDVYEDNAAENKAVVPSDSENEAAVPSDNDNEAVVPADADNEVVVPADTEGDADKDAESGSENKDENKDKDDTIQTDPYILDLAVCSGYNGIAVYAYTVDMDYDSGTTDDKELYIQFYDFEKHQNYIPVRLTEDSLSQSRPKLVRNDNNTYLFWIEGTDTLRYLNITELFKLTYVDGNGDTQPIIKPDGTVEDGYKIEPAKVDTHSVISDGTINGIGSYEVFTDANNDLYVVWTCTEQRDTTDPNWDPNEAPAQEIYATAMVRESDLNKVKTLDGVETTNAKESYARWSKPVKLTSNGRVNDGVAAALDSDGNLIIAYNQYDLTYIGEDPDFRANHVKTVLDEDGNEKQVVTADPYEMSPIDFKSTKLAPAGSFEAVKFAFSDKTPVAGDTIKVAALLQNTGLTAVRGAKVEFWTYKDGGRIEKIHEEDYSDETILVNTSKICQFDWKVPDDFEGMQIVCITKEANAALDGGYYPDKTSYSDKFVKKAELKINMVSAKQNGDKFDITYTVKNEGNKASDAATAIVELAALYGNIKDKYGLDDNKLFTAKIDVIKPNETKEYKESVEIPSSVFKYCGYDQINAYVLDAGGNVLNSSEKNTDDPVYVVQEQPMHLTLNGGKDITLAKGSSVELKTVYDKVPVSQGSTNLVYTVKDPSIATVENGVLTANGAGTTEVTVTALPYGVSSTVTVTVTASGTSSGGGSGSSSAAVTNPIKVSDKETEAASNGTVSIDRSEASAGTTVNVTVKPDLGYKADSIIVTDAAGNKVTVNAEGTNKFSFKMPQTAASIEPVFKPYDNDYSGCRRDDSCPVENYTDTDVNAWYHDAVHYCTENGLMNGTSAGTFSPKNETTRGMAATILNRMDGETKSSAANRFRDVQSGKYYADAVAWADENGIVTGYDSNTFGPDDPVTREQFAALLYRYTKYRKVDTSAAESTDISAYKDAGSVSSYAKTAMKWACGAGIVNGRSASQLAPKAKITRAEISQMLLNYISKMTA